MTQRQPLNLSSSSSSLSISLSLSVFFWGRTSSFVPWHSALRQAPPATSVMNGFLLFSVLCLGIAFSGASSQTPEYIKPCRRSDPNINVCVADSIAHLRDHLLVGIKDLDVPSIDPLRIPKIQMENGVGRIRIKAIFSDLTIYGPANHTLTGVRANVQDYTMEVAAKAPKLIVTGRYEVFGNVLVINIRSKGDFQAVFEDVSGVAKLQGKEIYNNSVKYMRVDKVGIDFKVGKARFRIRDRSSNSKVLGEAINNFLNENWREVMEEMKFTAAAAMGKYLKQLVNAALLKVPMNLWLIDD